MPPLMHLPMHTHLWTPPPTRTCIPQLHPRQAEAAHGAVEHTGVQQAREGKAVQGAARQVQRMQLASLQPGREGGRVVKVQGCGSAMVFSHG